MTPRSQPATVCLQVSVWRVRPASSVPPKVWPSLLDSAQQVISVRWAPQSQTPQTIQLDLCVHLGLSASGVQRLVRCWASRLLSKSIVKISLWTLFQTLHPTLGGFYVPFFYALGDCLPGFHCNWGSSRADETLCPAGFFCPSGTPVPLPCPAGTFSTKAGNTQQDNCTSCTSGYYCEGCGFYLGSYLKQLESLL